MGGLRVRLLGVPEFVIDGVPVELPRGRVLAVSVVLALSAGRPVAVETIAERVWGESQPADPRGAVHTAVGRLRRLLGPASVVSRGGGYELAVEPDDVDVLRFERLLDEADGLRLLREATALWRGEPFEPHLSDWLALHERPRLVDRYLTAVERRTDLDLAAGEVPAELSSQLRELGVRHPLRESLWLRLLRVLDATGRHADALTAYEELRRRIADELGVDPAAELRRLHADLLAGTSTTAGPASEAPRQLPADVDGITGREPALRRLDELLRNDAGLVVVHGTGGVGKTTLVVHWAHRVRDEFPDGQLFVDLRGFGPGEPMAPAAALAMLLHGLDVPAERIPDGTDARTALFRTTLAGRRALVVLDNARDAEQVRPLLGGAGIVTLVTSRNHLRGLAAREHAGRIALDVLSPAEATTILRERLKDQRIEYDETSVTRLAEICGGLPLALAIAAERAGRDPGSPLLDLVRQLEDDRARLDLLGTGADLSTDLRAVMSWSYGALDPDAADMFRLLGLPPGHDFTVPAVAALAGINRRAASRVLDRLADANLVHQPRTGRYTMHDLTRAYAAERAAEEYPPTVQRTVLARLYNWYAWSAANAKTGIQNRRRYRTFGAPRDGVEPLTFQDARQAMSWFGSEDQMLRLALAGANDLDLYDEVLMLGRALWNYWSYIAVIEDGETVALTALAAARATGDAATEAGQLNQLGNVYRYMGEHDRAVSCYHQSFDRCRDAGETHGMSQVLTCMGLSLRHGGQLADSIDVLERSATTAATSGHSYERATALTNLADSYRIAGRLADAIHVATEATLIFRDQEQPAEQAVALDTLALALLASGDHTAAAAWQRDALAIQRALGNRRNEAVVLRGLAQSARAAGELEQVRTHCRDGLRILDEIEAADTAQLSRADFHELLAGLRG